MDPPVDLDDAFMEELMLIVSPATTPPSGSELSFSSSPCLASVKTPSDDRTKYASTTDTAKPKPKRNRKGRRLEVLELRSQVAAYKQKLDGLLMQKYDKSTDSTFWKRTAHRIALEKRLAVRENLRLRALTEQTIESIQVLQQAILSIEASNPPERTIANEPTTDNEVLWPSDIDPNISDHSESIFLLSPPRNSAGEGKRRINVDIDHTDGVSSVRIHLEDVHSIPFNFHLVGVQAWSYLSQSHDHERRQGIYRDFKPEGDALVGILIQDGVGDEVLLRKHVEPHQVSLYWETTPHTGISGLRKQEKGCMRLEPSPEDPSHAAVCITTVHFAPQPLGESSVGVAVDAVLSTYENAIGFFRQAVIASLHNLPMAD